MFALSDGLEGNRMVCDVQPLDGREVNVIQKPACIFDERILAIAQRGDFYDRAFRRDSSILPTKRMGQSRFERKKRTPLLKRKPPRKSPHRRPLHHQAPQLALQNPNHFLVTNFPVLSSRRFHHLPAASTALLSLTSAPERAPTEETSSRKCARSETGKVLAEEIARAEE